MRRPPLGLKADPLTPAERAYGKRHMAQVARLPCIICSARPVDVHHVFHGRYGTRRASDHEVLPLCKSCHTDAPWSIHRDKKGWRDRHGHDFDLLPAVADSLAALALADATTPASYGEIMAEAAKYRDSLPLAEAFDRASADIEQRRARHQPGDDLPRRRGDQ